MFSSIKNMLFASWLWWNGCLIDKKQVIGDLQRDLGSTLFGQQHVQDIILDAITAHLNNEPTKALVLSFHGHSGVGKTYVAKKIAWHIFSGKNNNIKVYNGRNDFQSSSNHLIEKERLRKEMHQSVFKCPYSVFIFDESEQMPLDLFDMLKPYTNYRAVIDGVDFRKTIFIFLSNIGASEIGDVYYNSRKTRASFALTDLNDVLSTLRTKSLVDVPYLKTLYKFVSNTVEKSVDWLLNRDGSKDSTEIQNFQINWYVPFLPLEEEHVKRCIEYSLLENKIHPSPNVVEKILEKLPKKWRGDIQIYPSNCKRVSTEVAVYAASVNRQKRRQHNEF